MAGATVTIRTATSTPTNTTTNSPTSTFTPVPTATRTNTATATPPGNPVVVVFPNPVTGPTVNVLPPAYTGTADVRIEIFTLGFRKVQDHTYMNIPDGTPVVVQLVDRFGAPLANGLYYVVVTVDGHRSIALYLLDANRPRFMGTVGVPDRYPLPSVEQVVEVRYLYCHLGPDGKLIQAKYFGKVRDDIEHAECCVSQLKLKAHDSEPTKS